MKIHDYIIVGSGFGGSVSAMRLAEKGYSVLVLEKGKRYETADFPKTNWNIRKYLWLPLLKCFGIQKMTFFKDVFVISGVGVGGGSLVYANTHIMPPEAFFQNDAWREFKNWKSVLAPFYDTARFMLGTTVYPEVHEEDRLLQEIAVDMGKADSWHKVDVGVYFSANKTPTDPYFKGLGPERKPCTQCAGCMVGCRVGAKNTLDKNYLYFAQKYGAEVQAETLVTKVEFKDGLYHIHTKKSTAYGNQGTHIYYSKGLVMSGGVLGTMELLLKQKYITKTLSKLSDRLGENLRTNSESIGGIGVANKKLNHGVALSSVFQPDDDTYIEVVKFPNGSGAMGRLATLAAGEGSPAVRTAKYLAAVVQHPINAFRVLTNIEFSSNSLIILVMQTLDSKIKMVWKRGLFGGGLALETNGAGVPAYIAVGQEVIKRYAEKVDGIPLNAYTEIFLNMSTTAHILGGCPMGETADTGVIDTNFKAFGYPNMYILDGSIIPCNLGVNPSLTITALSEYAMAQIPEKEGNTNISLAQQLQNA